MLEAILKILLIMCVFANILSQTRLYDIKQELYLAKFITIIAFGVLITFIIILKGKVLRLPLSTKCICFTFLASIFFMVVSLFNTPYPLQGIFVIVSYCFLFSLSFLLLPNYLNKDMYLKYNRLLWGAIMGALILSAILGIKDPDSFYIIEDRIRYQCFFHNPVYLGTFSLLGILSSLQVYAISRKNRYLISVLPVLFLLYLSNTRASMLAAGVTALMIAFLTLLTRCNLRTKVLLEASALVTIGGLIVLGCIAIYLVPFETLNMFTSYRLSYWTHEVESLDNIQWLFGQGIGKTSLERLVVDNFYLIILLQTGLLGLSSFVLFIISVFYWLWEQLKKMPDDIALQVSIASFVALIIHSFFESALFSLGNILSIYIWINVGYQVVRDR